MTIEPTTARASPAASDPASTPATVPPPPTTEQTPAPSAAAPDTQDKTEPGQPAADQEAGQGEKDEQQKPKSRFQERIDRLTAEKRAAEARAAAAEARLKKLSAPFEAPEGRELSFEEQEELRLRQVLRRERAEELQQEAQQERASVIERRRQMFEAKVEAVADRMPDLVQKFAAVPCSDFAADFIAESDRGAEIAYYLGSNPHEANRLASLPDTRQAVELARLEARLNAAPQVRKISQAPTPPPMVGGGQTAPIEKPPSEMSMAEYSEWYRKRRR